MQKDSYESREVDAAFRAISKARYDTCLTPSCDINKNIGNCYSGSVFSSLLGLVCKVRVLFMVIILCISDVMDVMDELMQWK